MAFVSNLGLRLLHLIVTRFSGTVSTDNWCGYQRTFNAPGPRIPCGFVHCRGGRINWNAILIKDSKKHIFPKISYWIFATQILLVSRHSIVIMNSIHWVFDRFSKNRHHCVKSCTKYIFRPNMMSSENLVPWMLVAGNKLLVNINLGVFRKFINEKIWESDSFYYYL